jgi:hypothetical protein
MSENHKQEDASGSTQQWWEERVAREAAEKDARTKSYSPPPSGYAKTVYDEVYNQLVKPTEETVHSLQKIPVAPVHVADASAYQAGSTNSSELHVSSCIISFIIMLVIAFTAGLAVPFIIGLVFASFLGGPSAVGFILTAVIYIGLLGVVWWALYDRIKPKKPEITARIRSGGG